MTFNLFFDIDENSSSSNSCYICFWIAGEYKNQLSTSFSVSYYNLVLSKLGRYQRIPEHFDADYFPNNLIM